MSYTPGVILTFFSPEINNFCYIKKCRFRLHFNTQFLILLTLFDSLKVLLRKMVAILMMTSKLATQRLFESDN